jgi:hypothetical protein
MKNVLMTIAMINLVACGADTNSKTASQPRPVHKFVCGNVGGVEEHRIMVDLERKLASFFDNDTTVVVPFVRKATGVNFDVATIYVFEGEDTAGAPGDQMRIEFDSALMTGRVTLNLGDSEEETLSAHDGCVADDSIEVE